MPTPNLPPDDATLREWLEMEHSQGINWQWDVTAASLRITEEKGSGNFRRSVCSKNTNKNLPIQDQECFDFICLARNHFRPLVEEVLRLRAIEKAWMGGKTYIPGPKEKP